MYKVLDKDIIEMKIIPYISLSKRGFSPRVPLSQIVNAILHKIKTGVQREYLSVKYRGKLDLSSVDLDGSHTPVIRGGEGVDFQGRKKGKNTNTLYLTDIQGLPLAMSGPVAGNHNDLYDMEVHFEVVAATLEKADIPVAGLFMDTDAGFDSKDFRGTCVAREVNANVCLNKRNGSKQDRDEYFDQ